MHLHKKITRQLAIKDIQIKYVIHNNDYNFEEMLWKTKRKRQSDCREQQSNGLKSIEEVYFFSSVDNKNVIVDYSREFKR